MKLITVELYRDGGTRAVVTDQGTFYINTMSRKVWDEDDPFAGRVTDNWPNKGGQLVSPELEQRILDLEQDWRMGLDTALGNRH